MQGKFDQLTDKVEDTLKSVSFLSEKYEEIKGKMFQLEESRKDLKKENLFFNRNTYYQVTRATSLLSTLSYFENFLTFKS